MEQNITPNVFTLQIDNTNTAYLSEAARWAKFLSIVGFIFCGLIAIAAFFASSLLATYFSQIGATDATGELTSASTTFLTIYYLIIAVIYLIPTLYLFKFASKMQAALRNNDQVNLTLSFSNLKACFKFWGILFIIALCFFAIAIVVVVIGASLA